MPLELAPSQWEPLLSQLEDHFCSIVVGGAELGFVSILETRAQEGYGHLLQILLGEGDLRPGETVLEVGCGSGVYHRWLANTTGCENRITAIDVIPYLIREAAALARKEGLEGMIQFTEGDAESIPFPDNSFDVSMSVTVMEEVDADRMMAEMCRVTRPGGRVAVFVRSVDLPNIVNLPLGVGLRAKVEAPNAWGAGVGGLGFADASLYQRFCRWGLSSVEMLPQLATFANAANLEYLQSNIASILSPAETEEWSSAVDQVQGEGTFFIAKNPVEESRLLTMDPLPGESWRS
jgi:ubiquinone/menaquinone biosynthesis C-methylase UbiE